jgi:hypothetical protein
LKIPQTPSAEAGSNAQPVVAPAAKESEHAQRPASLQDDVKVGRVALAVSNSLESSPAKILQLQHQYLEGTYTIDAKDLSAKIVEDHLQK